MISEFENLSLGGNNTATNHADPFTHTGKLAIIKSICYFLTSMFYTVRQGNLFQSHVCAIIIIILLCFLSELTPEQQKTLIDIRRRKTELLLEIQVST